MRDEGLIFRTNPAAEPLTVSMSGVRLGDRVLVLGAGDIPLLAGVAVKSGLSGRTCLADPDEARARAAAAAAEQDGALVDACTAPWTNLPFPEQGFDVVILRHVLPALAPDMRAGCLHEVRRVLRPGGRVLAIDTARTGLRALLGGSTRAYAEAGGATTALTQQGFKAVRTLAERDALVFVEGVRPNV